MEEWKQYRLIDVLDTLIDYRGKTPKKTSSGVPLITAKIIKNGRIETPTEFISVDDYDSWMVRGFPKVGDVVLTTEAPLGEVAQLDDSNITRLRNEKVGKQEDVKVLSPVTTGKLMLSEEYFTKQVFSESIAKYKVVEIGDFAYNPARVNIGSIGRNEYSFRGCVSPVYVVFSCKDGYAYFFDLFRKTEKFQTEVNARAIGGVRQSLNYTDFCFIQTVIAPSDVMKSFNPIYEKIMATQKYLEEENSRLAELRDTLLPRLMSGEIKVENVAL